MFEHKNGNHWHYEPNAKVTRDSGGRFVASFPKPRLGTVEPPAPQVRLDGQEAISTAWVDWPDEPAGTVTVAFWF